MSELPTEFPAPADDHDYETPLPYDQEWVALGEIEIPGDDE